MPATGFATPRPALRFWLLFAAAVAAAWGVLLAMSVAPQALPVAADSPLRQLAFGLVAICRAGAEVNALPPLILMWGVMAIAMMAPSAVPFLREYARLGRLGPRRPPRFGVEALGAGYLAVWLVFAVVVAGLQQQLRALGVVDQAGAATSAPAVAGLLALAAGYQLSRWKAACLAVCRDPFRFFFAHWRDGVSGAFRMGVRQGLVCAGCCWALMLLAFVGGMLNVLWMIAITALMVLEKHPRGIERMRGVVAALLGMGAIAASLHAAGIL